MNYTKSGSYHASNGRAANRRPLEAERMPEPPSFDVLLDMYRIQLRIETTKRPSISRVAHEIEALGMLWGKYRTGSDIDRRLVDTIRVEDGLGRMYPEAGEL